MKNIDQSWFVATIDVHETSWKTMMDIHEKPWFVATIDVHEKPRLIFPHQFWCTKPRCGKPTQSLLDPPDPHDQSVGFVKSQRRTCHIFELWTAQHLLPLWCFMMFFFYDVLWCFIMMYYDVLLWCIMMFYDVSKLIMFHHLCFDFTHRFPHDGPVQKSRPGLSKWPSERWGTPRFGCRWIHWDIIG
jgi:hypothetical protein